jgi:hypothetical protein
MPTDQRFTEQFKTELSAALLIKFNISLDLDPTKTRTVNSALKRNQEIFYRCYRAVEKLSDLPQTFNAQYGLFRSLLTTFALLALTNVWKLSSLYKSGLGLHTETVLILGLFIFCAVISYYRAMKRGEDFARAVYDVFVANFASR